jgi:transcriptional regulator with XRE-family HTH domain
MLQSEHKPFKTNVEAAVAFLIGKGIIKKDADVVDSLKMSKGTFSAYKSGKTEPSKNFIQQFENYYKIKLADFSVDADFQAIGEHEHKYVVKELIEPDGCPELKIEVVYLRKRITDLERTIEDKVEIINLQRGMIQYESKVSG